MFWRGVVGYLPANVVQGVVGLLTIVAFTRLLTPAQFGDYALGLAAMTLAHTAVFTWNEAAMARFWARESHQDGGADHSATIYRAWLGLLLLLPVMAGLAALWPMSPGLKWALLAGLAAVPFRTFAKLAQERRRAAGEVGGAATLDMAQTVGGFVLGAALAWMGLGGAGPLLGYALASGLCTLWFLPGEFARARPGTFSQVRMREHAGYGVPVALSLILALVLASTDRFLLATFLDQSAVGVYHAGYSLANRTLDVVFIWLGAAGGPALIMALERGGRETLSKAAREQAQVMILLTVPAATGLALVAQPLSQLMIGQALSAGAAHVTPWIALSGLLGGLTTYYFHQAFTLGRKTRFLLVAMIIPAVLNVGLNLILIPRFGLDGALWATPISYGLGLVASVLLGRRTVDLPIPWRTVGEAVGASLVMALAVSAIPAWGGLLELVVKALAGGLIYVSIIALVDAGALRSRGREALITLRARSAT